MISDEMANKFILIHILTNLLLKLIDKSIKDHGRPLSKKNIFDPLPPTKPLKIGEYSSISFRFR